MKNEKYIAIFIWIAAAVLAFFVIRHIVLIDKTIKATK